MVKILLFLRAEEPFPLRRERVASDSFDKTLGKRVGHLSYSLDSWDCLIRKVDSDD